MDRPELVCYARTEMPASMPNLETLVISSEYERVNTPLLPTKFMFLKYLSIYLDTTDWSFCPSYDHFSLASFLDSFTGDFDLGFEADAWTPPWVPQNCEDHRITPSFEYYYYLACLFLVRSAAGRRRGTGKKGLDAGEGDGGPSQSSVGGAPCGDQMARRQPQEEVASSSSAETGWCGGGSPCEEAVAAGYLVPYTLPNANV
ncbi:hypothetical protein PR202_gb29012 [Eleusine coracana subsp. coracana]|uniref:At1g61320/AtMIF1 LRR domain-containing protein n=1 Tax=Eleusine coracana subsp. coracana TaxID=191504 RepID=A0AAV5FW43_ELECO|nr:hypothetical protein PR202_gb29012 [Eleusine coracana subsp. coracana]